MRRGHAEEGSNAHWSTEERNTLKEGWVCERETEWESNRGMKKKTIITIER